MCLVCISGTFLSDFAGGGGHKTAAAASVRQWTLLETRERLLHRLEEDLPPAAMAADLMISTFLSVTADETVREVKEQLLRGGVNAAPVLDPQLPEGAGCCHAAAS